MVDRVVVGTPYEQARRLIGWARENWADVDGQLTMRGIDIRQLPIGRALNVITAMVVDDAMPVVAVETKKGIELFDRRRTRREMLAELNGGAADGGVPQSGVTRRNVSDTWDRETWGLTPEHQASARAAMGFAAGLGG